MARRPVEIPPHFGVHPRIEEGFSGLMIMKNCGITPHLVGQLRTPLIPPLISRYSANVNRDITENVMLTDLDIKGHQPGEAEDGMKEEG
jgi:hypothetical protein